MRTRLKGKARKAWYKQMIVERARRQLEPHFRERNRRHRLGV